MFDFHLTNKLLVDFQITPLETLGQFYNKAFLSCFLIGYHYEFNGLGYSDIMHPTPQNVVSSFRAQLAALKIGEKFKGHPLKKFKGHP